MKFKTFVLFFCGLYIHTMLFIFSMGVVACSYPKYEKATDWMTGLTGVASAIVGFCLVLGAVEAHSREEREEK